MTQEANADTPKGDGKPLRLKAAQDGAYRIDAEPAIKDDHIANRRNQPPPF
jgi:hypothetical protein